MHLAPLGYDASATAHDAREALVGQVDVLQSDAAVYGEVVHALLTLFDKRLTEDVPRKVLGLAVHLLKGLVHGHRSHWHGTVAQDPLARLVYVVARGEIHERVATPFAAPHRFVDLLLDARCGGRVSDVGVDLHEEMGADDHRFRLGVLAVGGDDGASLGNLLAHKGRCDVGLDAQFLAVHVLAYGHILHLLCDDALLGEIHLRLSLLTTVDPWLAQSGQSLLEVDLHGGVAVGSAGVVYVDRLVGLLVAHTVLDGYGGRQSHAAHADAEVGIELAAQVNLL